ncbi:MAG: DUF2849 domain-containing protein [Stellaceae bacterium]
MTSPLDQKFRIGGPTMITANRLRDGAVIYRRKGGGWSTDLDDAVVVTDAAAAQALLREAAGEGTVIVGAYAAPVEIAAGGRLVPGNLRERIRLTGPTFDLPRVPARA